MQKIQDFLANNKVAVAAVAIVAAVGVGLKIATQDGRTSVKQLDASITKVPLIDRLGGDFSATAITNRVFDLMTNDKELKQHFQTIDKSKVKQHFSAQVKHLFGGPAPQQQKDLGTIHSKFNLTEQQFIKILKYLEQAMQELGVDKKEVVDAQEALNSIKNSFVVTNKSA